MVDKQDGSTKTLMGQAPGRLWDETGLAGDHVVTGSPSAGICMVDRPNGGRALAFDSPTATVSCSKGAGGAKWDALDLGNAVWDKAAEGEALEGA